MPNKPKPAFVVFALLVLVGLAALQWARRHAPLPESAAGPPPQLQATPVSVAATPEPTPNKPRLAFVIDDWGYSLKPVKAMQEFPGHLTIAVLPGLAHSRDCAEAAFASGHEVILHLPMEPLRKMPMIPGTLMVGMPGPELAAWMDRHAASVPHMSGLNNHEGSKGSADTALMRGVMAWLKAHGGYFLDSKTSPHSVGEAEARRAGVRHAARRIFLDNLDQPAAIEKAARQALAVAMRTGSCIAIGHPRENTLSVLSRLAPEFTAQGVDLVKASELAHLEGDDGR